MTAVAQFCGWCQDNGLQLSTIRPLHVSAYIDNEVAVPDRAFRQAASRGFFNWLVIKQVVPDNPALFVKGPKFSRQVGITPIMESEQVRQLLDSIPIVRKLNALIDSFLASQMPEEEKKNLIEATVRVVDDVKKEGRLTGATKMLWNGIREGIKIIPSALSAWDALMKHWSEQAT